MALEDLMPEKEASHRGTNTARFHLQEESKIVKLIEEKNGMGVARDWGTGERDLWSIGNKISVTQNE